MIKFERKRTYARFLGTVFFIASSISAWFALFKSGNGSIVAINSGASLTGNQLIRYVFVNYKGQFVLWLLVIIFVTLLGFLCGRFIDAHRSKYFIKLSALIKHNHSLK
jgi:hypothetical protein